MSNKNMNYTNLKTGKLYKLTAKTHNVILYNFNKTMPYIASLIKDDSLYAIFLQEEIQYLSTVYTFLCKKGKFTTTHLFFNKNLKVENIHNISYMRQ